MPLETLERTPPPFFRQGPSALSRLVFFTALALFLMVSDARLHIALPLRAVISAALSPVQMLTTQSLQWVEAAGDYLVKLETAERDIAAARAKLLNQTQRAGQVETLLAENQRLRALLGLRERVDTTGAVAAQVLYDATDPFDRRVVIDKGMVQGIQPGSPVIDDAGVLGQVTRVYPFVSEITLLVDNNQVIPVFSPRTGLRSIAHGDPVTRGGVLELRYVSATEDVQAGDLLTTSGIDGVYPPGLQVARVLSVERQPDSNFSRILCQPLARLSGVTSIMVLAPVTMPPVTDMTGAQLPPLARASEQAAAAPAAASMAVAAASRAAARAASSAARPAGARPAPASSAARPAGAVSKVRR
jgi:rod shape-determining protein MreC